MVAGVNDYEIRHHLRQLNAEYRLRRHAVGSTVFSAYKEMLLAHKGVLRKGVDLVMPKEVDELVGVMRKLTNAVTVKKQFEE